MLIKHEEGKWAELGVREMSSVNKLGGNTADIAPSITETETSCAQRLYRWKHSIVSTVAGLKSKERLSSLRSVKETRLRLFLDRERYL